MVAWASGYGYSVADDPHVTICQAGSNGLGPTCQRGPAPPCAHEHLGKTRIMLRPDHRGAGTEQVQHPPGSIGDLDEARA